MRIVINTPIAAEDLITDYGAGAKVYLDSSTSEGGAYSSAATALLVAGTEQYELYDSTGADSTWYKARFGNAVGSRYSDYGDAFQATSVLALATLDDCRRALTIDGTAHDAYLSTLLEDVTADAHAAAGRSFLRYPQVSGTATFYCDVKRPGMRSLVSAMGQPYTTDGRALDLLDVSSTWVRLNESAAYQQIDAEADSVYFIAADGGGGYRRPLRGRAAEPVSPHRDHVAGR